MIKRILVALSGTAFTLPAVERAIELARHYDAELWGVTDLDVKRVEYVGPVPMGGGKAAATLAEHKRRTTEEHIEEAIGLFEDRCTAAHIAHTTHRETGRPLDRLAELWRYCDLTVMGLRGLFDYEVLHEPDDVLIRLVTRGVRPIVAVAATHRPVTRALIAYSGSLESAKTMKRYIQLRPWPEAETRIVCFHENAAEATALLDDAAAYCALHGVEAATAHVAESPKEWLLPYAAETGSDLIVMGSTARRRLMRHLLGDTVLEAIRNATVPLFLCQ